MEMNDTNDFINKLVENTSFIQWVKSEFEENDDYWSEFIDSHDEQYEEINQAIKIVNSLKFDEVDVADQKKVIWNRIENSIQEGNKSSDNVVVKKGLVKNIYFRFATLAAACIAIFFIFRNTVESEYYKKTGIGEQITVILPDQSQVVLNSISSISYNPDKWEKERKVKLEGEAFFKVQKGEKFTVLTKAGNVQVLGTSFNVFVRENDFITSCFTGRVGVEVPDSPELILLNPGEKMEKYHNKELSKTTFSVENDQINWTSGVFKFDKAAFEEVVAEFERQFNYDVIIPDGVEQRFYTGFFKNTDLNEALESIAWPMGLKFEVQGDKILLTGETK
ncbi:MAG: FecR family protein [Saprospiraceae bacterium]|nr:FecR family protein [Saprospiraceae bacterium]